MSESGKVLLVSSKCPFCEFLKEKIERKGLKISIVNVETEQGKELAEKHGIEAVPECLVLINENNVKKDRLCSETELEELFTED